METRSMTDADVKRIERGLKQSKTISWVWVVLSLPFVALALVKGLSGDMLVMGIMAGLAVLFLIPGIGGMTRFGKYTADLREKTAVVERISVTDKREFVNDRGGHVISYIISAGKLEYHFPKDVYDRINPGDELQIVTAQYSGEMLAAVSSSGENYPLI